MRVTKKDTIFVQIASYRDPELNNTLEYLFKNAKYPDNLRVCIAWQHSDEDEWDNLDKWKKDKLPNPAPKRPRSGFPNHPRQTEYHAAPYQCQSLLANLNITPAIRGGWALSTLDIDNNAATGSGFPHSDHRWAAEKVAHRPLPKAARPVNATWSPGETCPRPLPYHKVA